MTPLKQTEQKLCKNTFPTMFLLHKIALPYPHKCLFGFVEQNKNSRPTRIFLRKYSCHERWPLVCACPRLRSSRCRQTNVESSSLYFWSMWEQHVFFLIIAHIQMKIYEVLKRASMHLAVVIHYSSGTTTNSAFLVLKRVRIRCCARRCCCKVFSGRRCISLAVLAHYETGTTSLSMKGMQRRFCCKVFSGKLLYCPLFDGTA